MGKKEKNKEKKKEKKKKKKELLNGDNVTIKLKKKCCEKYKKGEHKRCKNCPRFDLEK